MERIEAFLTRNPCYQANLTEADSRYADFHRRGPRGLMLHSVGCAQPSAEVFVKRWNSPDRDDVCVHAFVDANTGAVWQTLPWTYRGWHCGGTGNNTHIGVELCESRHIRYTGANKFEILDRAAALADCRRTYDAGVALFAALCRQYGLDPATAICSHKEGARAGIASDHGDPEHYWTGLGSGCTMDGFRRDVAAALAAEPDRGKESGTEKGKGPKNDPAAPGGAAEETGLPFPDVRPGDWYLDALRWAVEARIVLPGEAPFRPEAPLTKAAAVVWLRRLANRS